MNWFGRRYLIDQIKFHRRHASEWMILAQRWPERADRYKDDAKRNRDNVRRLIKEIRWKDQDHERAA